MVRTSLPGQRIRSVVFGKTKEELFAVTFGSSSDVQVKRVNVPVNRFENVGLAAPKDQFLRLVAGPSTSGRRLIATSLYQSIDSSDNWRLPGMLAEPICFQGTTG